MKLALNWFEVTLPATEFKVAVEVVDGGRDEPPKTPHHAHRVVRRQNESTFRFLHLTNNPPSNTTEQALNIFDDPSFVKIAVEEGFARLLKGKEFIVCRQHVGCTGYTPTSESMFPNVYTFFRGVSFRSFYGFGPRPDRWGLILNYATSQRFCITLEDPQLRQLAIGKRVVPISAIPSADEDDGRRSGILVSVQGQQAVIEQGKNAPIQAPLGEWTLPCRRELLNDYLQQAHGPKASADVTRHLQVAGFSLTKAGRMNTALAKDQLRAVQQVLHDHSLAKFCLPLPNDPPVSLSDQPLVIAE
ncbi:MAG: hypothetical protein HYX68_13980 [Planctomycetes bacterium]|nr:hypothetical protein [Planctomycetota bacterium]